MRQLTGADAQWLMMESPTTYGHFSFLAVLAPGSKLTVGDLRGLIEQRSHLLPPFRWRLATVPLNLDNPYWVEDSDFDIEFHVRDLGLPSPGSERQLIEQVTHIVSRPLDRSRPLWAAYLIHGLEGDRQAILTTTHHAAIDGASTIEILSTLLDTTREGRRLPPAPTREPGRVPSQWELLARGLVSLPLQPLRMLRPLPDMASNMAGLPMLGELPGAGLITRLARRVRRQEYGRVLERPEGRVPRTRFNATITPHRRVAVGTLPMSTVKAIKNAFGFTVNDVVIALCAASVRSWLLERGELPPEPLVASIPVSVRAPHEQGTFGNRISIMLVPIPTDQADPEARLRSAHEVMRSAKEQHNAMPANLIADMTGSLPPALAARVAGSARMATRAPAMANLVISNVPGPRQALYCAGVELDALFPVSTIMEGNGLNISVIGYRGNLDFGVVVDRDQVDDPWPFIAHLRDALDELEKTIVA